MNYNTILIAGNHTTCHAGWAFHYNSVFYRIYYVHGGEAYIKIKGQCIQFEKGHIYILPMCTEYELFHNPLDPFVVTWIHADICIERISSLIDLEIESGSVLYHMLHALKGLFLTENADAFTLTQLFDMILTEISQISYEIKITGSEINSVIRYIDSNLSEMLTVNQLAERENLNRSYFTRKFSEMYGISPSKFITARKMNYAMKMLVEGRSVSYTSSSVGYDNYKTFARAFINYFGINPSKCRNNFKFHP